MPWLSQKPSKSNQRGRLGGRPSADVKHVVGILRAQSAYRSFAALARRNLRWISALRDFAVVVFQRTNVCYRVLEIIYELNSAIGAKLDPCSRLGAARGWQAVECVAVG